MTFLCFVLNLLAFAVVRCRLSERSPVGRRPKARPVAGEFPEFLEFFLVCLEICPSPAAALSTAAELVPEGKARCFAERVRAGLYAGLSWAGAVAQAGCDDDSRRLAEMLRLSQDMGAGIGQGLAALADSMRRQHMAELEERTARLPVKMLFPLVLFILPSLLILLGAGVVADLISLLGAG